MIVIEGSLMGRSGKVSRIWSNASCKEVVLLCELSAIFQIVKIGMHGEVSQTMVVLEFYDRLFLLC